MIFNKGALSSGGKTLAQIVDKSITKIKASYLKHTTTIGDYAFYNCSLLTSVEIPNNIETISDIAFTGCTLLTDISTPAHLIDSIPTTTLQSLTISSGDITSFDYSSITLLTSLTIGEKVTSIDDNAFKNCTSLTEINFNSVNCKDLSIASESFCYAGNNTEGITVNIGTEVTHIPAYLFSPNGDAEGFSPNITTINFAKDSILESINEKAFYNCTQLKTINIPDNAFTNTPLSISEDAFDNCLLLEYNKYENALYLGNDSNPYVLLVKLEDTSVTSYILQNTKTICSNTFTNCSSLEAIYFKGTKEEWNNINKGNNNDPLTTAAVYFYSETKPNNSNFWHYDTDGITPIEWKTEGLDYALSSDGTCYSCVGIGTATDTDIIIPSTYNGLPVTTISSYAFRDNAAITTVSIGSNIASIGKYAFYNCTNLTEINYNATECADFSSGNYVFYNAGQSGTGITVTIGANVKKIPAYLFYPIGSTSYAPKITSVSFEKRSICESIGDYAFNWCWSLKSIAIGNSVKSIGDYAFSSCYSLTDVTLGDRVASIGNYAFAYCGGLTSLTIPEDITSIGNSAFYNCLNLIEIYNLSTLTITVGLEDNGYVAYYAKNIYTANGGSSKLEIDENNYVFYKDGETITLAGYKGYETELTLPTRSDNKTYSINKNAFYHRLELTSVIIPDCVTSIKDKAFWDCNSLTSVTIGNNVMSIGNCAFGNCDNLTNITMGSNLKTIGQEAFRDCPSLKSIIIPSSVTNINYWAFYACSNLTSVTFKNPYSWYRCSSETATSGTYISYSYLLNTTTAARYLKSTYYSYWWKRF